MSRRLDFDIILPVVIITSVLLFVVLLEACSTMAEYVEAQIPPVVEPQTASFAEDQCTLEYRYCSQGQCVTRISEVTRFELTVDGEVIECVGVYLEIRWPDKSSNHWLWPSSQSDSRCEMEMQRLANPE